MYINFSEKTSIFKEIYEKKLNHNNLLSEREYQCMKLLAHGKRRKEIAYILHLSLRTVETHMNNIKSKIGPISSNPIVDYYWLYYDQKNGDRFMSTVMVNDPDKTYSVKLIDPHLDQ